jgi:predicted TIM-barrel fold metal-dependent hydrolase
MVLVVGACTPRAPQREAHALVEAIPVIDAHIHTDWDGTPKPSDGMPYTREQLERELRNAGVVGAIAHTARYDDGWVELRSRGVVHCAGIDAEVDAARLEEGLAAGRYRCIKIYLGYVHQWAHDPKYEPAYRLAEKHGVPVVFHTGDTYSTKAKLKYADPLTIDEVAVDHPNVSFVIAHLGNPWTQSAVEVAYKNPNVFLDGSALVIGDLSRLTREDEQRLVIDPIRHALAYLESPDKLMFGSDWPLVSIGAYADLFRRAVPPQHQRAVMHDNAARVFKLSPR